MDVVDVVVTAIADGHSSSMPYLPDDVTRPVGRQRCQVISGGKAFDGKPCMKGNGFPRGLSELLVFHESPQSQPGQKRTCLP